MKVYDVELWPPSSQDSGACALLSLPAQPYELLDALDKLRLNGDAAPCWWIAAYHTSTGTLTGDQGTIFQLNTLAQKLSQLDDRQRTIFAGLLQMEDSPKVPISRMIDLACGTDHCHLVEEALNDAQLGRFYAENGFVPGVDDLPDSAFELLDFEKIGRDIHRGEGGVFVPRTEDHPGGYVVRHSELTQVCKDLDLTPKQPDYTILLQMETGSQCRLPSAVLPQGRYTCLDCRVPTLTDAVSDAEDIYAANRLAQRLADMRPRTLSAYKALLEATDCMVLQTAEVLADSLDNYMFSPQFSSPIEVAKGELSVILPKLEAERLIPFLNLHAYGESLIQRDGGVLTDYGLIERKDGQPVQTLENQPRQGGMTMQ